MVRLLQEKVALLERQVASQILRIRVGERIIWHWRWWLGTSGGATTFHYKEASLPQFAGSKEQDGDTFDQWICKLSRHAELRCRRMDWLAKVIATWVGCTVLSIPMNFFLRELVTPLQKQWNQWDNGCIQFEALLSAQLMKRKQQTVDTYAKNLSHCLRGVMVGKLEWTYHLKNCSNKTCLCRDCYLSGRKRFYLQQILI